MKAYLLVMTAYSRSQDASFVHLWRASELRACSHGRIVPAISLSQALPTDVETLCQTFNEHDAYQSAVCPNCQQLRSINPANGEILVEDGLGDP
jgi:hypothetical protein